MASIGEILEEARIRQGRTINEAAQETRISPRFIEALELDRFEELPAAVYAKGFLRSYATYLQLDPGPLVTAFERFTLPEPGTALPETLPIPEVVEPPTTPSRAPSADPFRRSTQAPPPVITDSAVREAGGDDTSGDSWDDDVAVSNWGPGVLRAGDETDGANRGLRAIAFAAGAGFIALVVVAVIALANRGGGGSNAAAPPLSATPTSTATVASGASATAPPPSASPTATTSATATPTIVDRTGDSPTPAGSTAGRTPTPARTSSTATLVPTGTPSPTPTHATTATPTPPPPPPTPTATPPPPTPTAVPPTPTRVNVTTPGMYDLCSQTSGGINCGDTANYTVICAPNGPFIDPSGSWVARANSYGWTVSQSPNPTRASVQAACG